MIRHIMSVPLLFPPSPPLGNWIHHVMVMATDGAFAIPAVLHPNIVLFARGSGSIESPDGVSTPMTRACLKGPCLAPRIVRCQPGSVFICILFRVGTMAEALGPSVAQFRDRIIPLDQVFAPGAVKCLLDQIDEADDPAEWVALAQSFVAARLRDADHRIGTRLLVDPRLLFQPAADIAATLGVGVRQLERRLDHGFGANLRDVRRMVRFGHCLARLAGRVPQRGELTRTAHELGYYDHPHLDREFRALAGASPGVLLDGTGSASWLYRLGQRQFHDLFMPGDVDSVQASAFAPP